MGKVIDLTKLDGAHSLGKNFSTFVLGDEIKEALEKLLDAVKQGKSVEGSEGYTANNLFIDGRRGSGKTTILLTIKDLLERNFEVDIPNNIEKELNDLIKELKTYSFQVVDSIIDTSVNTASITFYFLSWLKKQIEKEYESDLELNEQLHRTIKIFPDYLKSCEKTCLDMSPDGDIEEKLDQSDLNFRKELFKLIDVFLERESCKGEKFISLFMDDLDISFPPERIFKILTEIFMFLSHPKLIIISSGNYKNLLEIIMCKISESLNHSEECLDKGKIRNIAKSILEKTFATHSMHIPHLIYDNLKTFKIIVDEYNELSIIDFLESIPIVKLLSFDSATIFKVLFNEITLRELILILKRVKQIKQKYENKTWEEIPIFDLSFSPIYQEVKNLKVLLSSDQRIHTYISDSEKPHEFIYIAKRIAEGIENTDNNIFFNQAEHSIITTTLNIKNKSKIIALFWLWLNEHLVFMNGLISSIPKLIALELFASYSNTDLSEFIEFWKNLNFSIKDLLDFCSFQDKKIKAEKKAHLAIQIPAEINDLFDDKLTIKKGDSYYIHLLKILDFASSLEINLSELLTKEKKFHCYQVIPLLDNFKDKLLNNLGTSEAKDFSIFLALYFNLVIKLISYMNYGINFNKGIFLQNFINQIDLLSILRRTTLNRTIQQIQNKIRKNYKLLLEELLWLTQRKGLDVTINTYFRHLHQLKNLMDILNIESLIESRLLSRDFRNLKAILENDLLIALNEQDENSIKAILMDIRRYILRIRRYLISQEYEILQSLINQELEKTDISRLKFESTTKQQKFLIISFVYSIHELLNIKQVKEIKDSINYLRPQILKKLPLIRSVALSDPDSIKEIHTITKFYSELKEDIIAELSSLKELKEKNQSSELESAISFLQGLITFYDKQLENNPDNHEK